MDADVADAIILDFIAEIFQEEEERKLQFLQLKLERRLLRDACNSFTLDSEFFRKYYRLVPEVALTLVHLIEHQILQHTRSAIPPHIQTLIALRFFAEGTYQKGVGQDFMHPVSQTVVSRCVNTVVNAINTLTNRFIEFPNTADERQRVQNNFQRSIRIPGILGLIDGFLVSFKKPSENEEAFYNYRVGTAINVQIIVDSEYIIRSIRSCPGCNNDRYNWQLSEAKQYLEALRNDENIINAEGNYYILGDSGYTPSPVLLTPVINAEPGTPAAMYTEEHVRTRSQVERTIGVLSGVWMAINRARKLYYSPEKVARIINACAILHNLRKRYGIIDDDIDIVCNNDVNIENNHFMDRDYPAGIAERERLINLHYS